jgi:hypothetical protein
MFWHLTVEQEHALKAAVQGKVIHDLGAGDLSLSKEMIRFGARKVIAVEKELQEFPVPFSHKLFPVSCYFHDYKAPIATAVVSWPVNWETKLVPLLERAKSIVYLGKNTDGSMCGTAEMFRHFLTRSLCAYVPSVENTLMVYGDKLDTVRTPRGEEAAALTLRKDWLTFEEAERIQ